MDAFFLLPFIPLIGGILTLIYHFRKENTKLLTNVFSGLLLAGSILAALILKHPQRLEMIFYINHRQAYMIELLIDNLTILMLLLISFISFIVNQYATKYLRSDITQGRFMAQLSLLTASVIFLVMSGNLLTAFFGWEFSGLTLYLLLNHYHYDSNANRAAKKKFIITRVGDIFFLFAVVISYYYFHTSEFRYLAEQPRINLDILGMHPSVQSIMLLMLFIAVMTKCAQFPFHFWLPDTMQTPTPVSAMMHAGVINAGGFLLARLSEFIITSQDLSNIIYSVGLISVITAAFFALTVTDVKKQLAYSTMGQMGYMLVECGLGLYTAAVFHLIAHGFFKAYLFLSAASNLGSSPFNHGMSYSHGMASRHGMASLAITLFSFILYSLYLLDTGQLNSSELIVGLFIAMTIGQFMAEIIIIQHSHWQKLAVYTLSLILLLIYLNLVNSMAGILNNTVRDNVGEFSIYKISLAMGALAIQSLIWLEAIYSGKLPQKTQLYLYNLSKNKFYIEETIRQYFLAPFCKLSQRMNYWLATKKERPSLNMRLIILLAFSYLLISLLSFKLGQQSLHIIINLVFFLICAIAAYKAPSIRMFNNYLFISQLFLVNVGLITNQSAIREIAIFQLINSLLVFGGISLICQYQAKGLARIPKDDNRLIWSSFYFSILVFLLIGFPFSASFISEVSVIISMFKINLLFMLIVALGLIFIAMAILHALQLHVFNRDAKFLRNSRHLPQIGHLFLCLCIIINIVNGILPNLLIDKIKLINSELSQ